MARVDDAKYAAAARAARVALEHNKRFRSVRFGLGRDDNNVLVASLVDAPTRSICDAARTRTIPGDIVGRDNDDPTAHVAEDEA